MYATLVDSTFPLADTYWVENMTRPVLFDQALGLALTGAAVDVVLEIEPHPTLKGPATRTIQDVLPGKHVPCHGMLSRGSNAVQSVSEALWFLWCHLDLEAVDLDGFEKAMAADDRRYSGIKGLRTYQWNHGLSYWHDS